MISCLEVAFDVDDLISAVLLPRSLISYVSLFVLLWSLFS